jgi:hypothetical protein
MILNNEKSFRDFFLIYTRFGTIKVYIPDLNWKNNSQLVLHLFVFVTLNNILKISVIHLNFNLIFYMSLTRIVTLWWKANKKKRGISWHILNSPNIFVSSPYYMSIQDLFASQQVLASSLTVNLSLHLMLIF